MGKFDTVGPPCSVQKFEKPLSSPSISAEFTPVVKFPPSLIKGKFFYEMMPYLLSTENPISDCHDWFSIVEMIRIFI